ncbi:MAG: hypothetical protein M1486_03410 [Gammaproteobacteria bacterium]|nr:hypothetical protein [Gammaproteobacteria bacterium]
MGLPKKALRESQFKFHTVGSAVKDGSHQISRVTFIEGGVEKTAFFKRLEPKNHYPELLAKISVAISLFKRIFQGKNSAEERLVFDDEDKLVGTLSIAIDGFKSFNFAEEPVPSDPIAKDEVIPCKKTLLEKFIIGVLFGRWFLDDDDGHPHNLGFAGNEAADIDFDMFLYWFTIYMKEPRPVIGVPKKRIDLTVRDWETFPNVKDSKPYHWATFEHPGQETLPTVVPTQILKGMLPKVYADPAQFEQLAHEPLAHEQKFAAAMKALLTYQPEMVRKRLTDLFGEMTLNYTSLDDTDVNLRVLYEREFPTFCNDLNNSKLFVDFIMQMYQKHYDNLYRIVVFHMGCDDNGYGVTLESTCSALYHKPSVYKGIEEWVTSQNDTLYKKDDVSAKYDLAELQNRYHQIWRDAYAPTVRDLLHDSFDLTKLLLKKVSSDFPDIIEIEGKKVTDDSLTSAWELFGAMPELSIEKIEPMINVDKESKLRDGLKLLVNFTQEFHDAVKTYYGKERSDLTEGDNRTFSIKLNQLFTTYDLEIRVSLAHTSTYAAAFNIISTKLQQVMNQANFQRHLTTTDEQMKDTVITATVKEPLPHTHEDVIRKYNETLFLWAKNTKPEDLSQYIIEIIDKYYAPTLVSLSYRTRSQPVKDFLVSSMSQSGDNRLAYILSSGKEEAGALNSYLIQHLTPIMLQSHPLPSVSNAIRKKNFDADLVTYTKAAVNFAKLETRFTHLANNQGVSLFYNTMYNWVEHLPDDRFNKIMQVAIGEYETGLSRVNFWSSGSRRTEVEEYCKKHRKAKAVALTFLNGSDTSTMKSCLFEKIISEMKIDISKSSDLQNLPGCKLVAQYNPLEHKPLIFAALKTYAEEPSHMQDETKTIGLLA